MSGVPVGYLVGVLVVATMTYLALWPRPTNGPRATPALVLGMSGSELPFFYLALNLLSTAGAVSDGSAASVIGGAALTVSLLALIGQVVVIALAYRTRATFADALAAAFGTTDLRRTPRLQDWLRAALAPIRLRRGDVERIVKVSYGPHGSANLLDIYRSRTTKPAKGVLIHLHGGGFFSGRRSKEARLLVERFAASGWLCLSADYRLQPAAFPDQAIDGKRVIAWARQHAADYGGNPARIVLIGGSAGAHIAMICALTAGDPRFQPGFEDVDTRLSAVIGLYGYYGSAPTHGMPSSPEDYLTEQSSPDPGDHPRNDVPPIMIVHGDRDPMVAPAMARELADQLRRVSAAPVVYVELPGAHHALGRFDSLRCCGIADGVKEFLTHALELPARV
jgi:acetyl esterase/lipase